uniref:LEM domain containing 1 n=1 Tax=Myripristis murdjan TaxID=586833 RepID=A0A667ZZQ2_9TELE
MPVFVEDPAKFSKSRLKSDLVAHNVSLPSAESKKEVYVQLYLKHVNQKNAADFSSDEEDHEQDAIDKEEHAKDPQMLDLADLTDDDLKAMLLKHGVKAGPIVGSTRALYERKLKKLLEPDAQHKPNGTGDGALYSDSEEEEEDREEEEEEELDSEQVRQERAAQLEEAQQEISQLTQEPVTDIPQEILPDSEPTPTGIHVTRRRPIKGAAGRPIQYKYPDTPVSPMTRERQEVERRLVPIYIQILVFLIVACLLYLIYAYVEDNSFNPFVALLDSLNQESGSEEGHLLQAETQDTPVLDTLTGQE